MYLVSAVTSSFFLLSCIAFAKIPADQIEVVNALDVTVTEHAIAIVGSPAASDLTVSFGAPRRPLKIRFPATAVAGLVRMMDEYDRSSVMGSTQNLVLIGDVAEVSVSWADLCSYVTGDVTCKTAGTKKVIVGIDSYGDGFTTGTLRNSSYKQVFEIVVLGVSAVR